MDDDDDDSSDDIDVVNGDAAPTPLPPLSGSIIISRNRLELTLLRSLTSDLLQDAFPVLVSWPPDRLNPPRSRPVAGLLSLFPLRFGIGKRIKSESLMFNRFDNDFFAAVSSSVGDRCRWGIRKNMLPAFPLLLPPCLLLVVELVLELVLVLIAPENETDRISILFRSFRFLITSLSLLSLVR